MNPNNNRHRPGYHLEREQKDKELRKAAKVVQWDEDLEVVAKKEREVWRYDLEAFCKQVMPNAFPLEFGPHHKSMLKKMQDVILEGGKTADAMPRGSGKSTTATAAFIWGALYGHLKYGAIIGNESEAAKGLLESIKVELWLGAGIGKYWPKLQAYLERGDGQSNKFRHLLNSDQSPCLIKWSTDQIRLPSTPSKEGDEWSGAILHACGITGRIRGMQTKTDEGAVLRPDFVLIDDPQTRASAKSLSQINDRENTITGDIQGLAGPGKQIACFMAMTVIYPNDLACRFLDKKQHPEWRATKVPMVISWPDALDTLWEEYNMLRISAMQQELPTTEANEFYAKNKEKMDAGAEVYWEERKFDKDQSALQHAMNLYFDDKNAFLAEYQNEPVQYTGGSPYILEEMNVMTATNGMKRLEVPRDANIIVSMTDINYSGLNTVVMASTNNGVRYIIDYQTYPGSGKPLYERPEGRNKADASEELAIAKALEQHIPLIASKRYVKNGTAMYPDLVLIDCGFKMDLVFRWCEANRHRLGTAVYPSRGRSYNQYRPTSLVGKPGDNFHVADWQKRGRVLVHNADAWRMRSQKAFLLPPGAPGSVTIFGNKPTDHKRFADEVCAEVLDEYIEETSGGNEFYKWFLKVGSHNDLLDAMVGAFVGTSFKGASETGLRARVPAKGQRARARRRAMPQIRI